MSSVLSKQQTNELRKHIQKRRGMKAAPVAKAKKPTSNDGGLMKKTLACTMFLLSFVIVGLMVLRVGAGATDQAYAYQQQDQYYDDYRPQPEPEMDYKPEPAPPMKDERVDQLSGRMQRLETKVWLLGVQANQNAVVNKEADRQFHRGKHAERYITITKDWKLKKRPDNLRFSEEHRQQLEKHIAD